MVSDLFLNSCAIKLVISGQFCVAVQLLFVSFMTLERNGKYE